MADGVLVIALRCVEYPLARDRVDLDRKMAGMRASLSAESGPKGAKTEPRSRWWHMGVGRGAHSHPIFPYMVWARVNW